MSEEFIDEDPEDFLREEGLIGDTFILYCDEEPSDFLTLRRVGVKQDDNTEAIISLISHMSEVQAKNDKISGGIILTSQTARVLAAALINAADEIDGFKAMFNLGG